MSNRAYTKIDNEMLQDPRISRATKGLICELKSRPDDWEIFVEGIIATGKEGKAAVYRMIKEAKQFGYMDMDRQTNKDGTVKKVRYSVTDCPLSEKQKVANHNTTSQKVESGEVDGNQPLTENQEVDPLSDYPLADNPLVENPTQQIKERYKGKKRTKNGRRLYDDRFNTFWEVYQNQCRKIDCREGTKSEAFDEWLKLSDDDLTRAEQGLKPYVKDCHKSDQPMKHCCRYLKYAAWEAYEADLKQWYEKGPYEPEYLKAVLDELQPNGRWPEQLGPPPGDPKSPFTPYIDELNLHKYMEVGNDPVE